MSLWRRVLAYGGVAFAGFMFLAAGLLKGLDPAGFAGQIAQDVPFLSSVATPLAVAGIAVETVLGTAYLLGFRRRWLLAAGLVLVVLFMAVTVPKLGSDDPTDCGCFGNFVVRTPAQVLMEDLGMAAGLLLGFLGGPGSRLRPWRTSILAPAAIIGITLPLAAPALPLDDFATRLKPGATMADLQLLEAIPDLEYGAHVIILADAPFGTTVDAVKARIGWDVIEAVANDRMLAVSQELSDQISRPGPRIAKGLEAFARFLHPELFD